MRPGVSEVALGCIPDRLNLTLWPTRLTRASPIHSMIQIVQFDVLKLTFRACATAGL